MKDDPVLAQLLEHRYASLVGYARLVGGTRDDAEDLAHDAIVAVFSKRRRFDSLEHAHAYVLRAIASRHVDAVRRRSRRIGREAATAFRDAAVVQGPETAVADNDAIMAALAALGPRERACVVLRHLADQSVADTARALGISDGAVKRYTSDGLAALAATGLVGDDAAGVERETSSVRTGGRR
ncbi:sigma-70 family RNA polymerase sigma factor [Demequina salsinemoris]|uniref:sigma-70 family RNA polymerase sigma factor n=1 Tax=Demequina salsinemoris TaxID=577470 RepID=UPI000A3DADB1|nr:sigma-70 family RNA polymerase sigma factor [Demequina salsinemoris]